MGGGRPPPPFPLLPVVVAEVRVQRVHVHPHGHGGAQQLRDHLSEPKRSLHAWEGVGRGVRMGSKRKVEKADDDSRNVPVVAQPLGSAALVAARGFSRRTRSVLSGRAMTSPPPPHPQTRRSRAAREGCQEAMKSDVRERGEERDPKAHVVLKGRGGRLRMRTGRRTAYNSGHTKRAFVVYDRRICKERVITVE